MNIPETYNYLVRARCDLWPALQSLPDEFVSRTLLPGDRFHSIKDIVHHIAAVEDGWIREDILRQEPLRASNLTLKDLPDGPIYGCVPLETLLNFARDVEKSTLAYLAVLNDAELRRTMTPHDAPDEHYTVDGILWHVLIHEIRHTAQITTLLRQQDIKPPYLDLLNYLPRT